MGGCRLINSSKPPILYQFNTRKPSRLETRALAFSSYKPEQEETISTATKTSSNVAATVEFKTLESCKLGISRYPDFEYDARGGTGTAFGAKRDSDEDKEVSVSFDLKSLYIPPLTSETTKFLGLPLPPRLKIDIVPQIFQGNINQESGQVS